MVDVLVLLALLAAAVSGLRRGLLPTMLGLVGAVAGALFGLRVLPSLLVRWDLFPQDGSGRALVLLLTVIGCAVIGSGVMEGVARAMLRVPLAAPAALADAAAGMVASVLVAAFLLWAVTAAVRPALPTAMAAAVSNSHALRFIDDAMPPAASRLHAKTRAIVDASPFPQVLDSLTPERIVPVPAPDAQAAQSEVVAAVAPSVVRVIGKGCDGMIQGSGWVVAANRVVTNAHVVAGTDDVSVRAGWQDLPASVVAFDPNLDMAILAVSLDAPALPRVDPLTSQQDAVVLGYPDNGPFTATSVRVRSETTVRATDIYHENVGAREVYSMYGSIHPGNSGGPVIDLQGRVAGTVFARSTVDEDTAYAVTDEAARALLNRANQLGQPVSTQRCQL